MPAARIGFHGAFQFQDARLDVFELDSFDRAIKYKLGRPEPDRRRYTWIGHKLEGDRASSARSLLHPCDGLTDSLPTCPEILHVELWLPHPSAKRLFRHAHDAGSVFDASLRQERSNRLVLLAPEFRSVSGHLRSPAVIWE